MNNIPNSYFYTGVKIPNFSTCYLMARVVVFNLLAAFAPCNISGFGVLSPHAANANTPANTANGFIFIVFPFVFILTHLIIPTQWFISTEYYSDIENKKRTMRCEIAGGIDGARTRDLLRDRQTL